MYPYASDLDLLQVQRWNTPVCESWNWWLYPPAALVACGEQFGGRIGMRPIFIKGSHVKVFCFGSYHGCPVHADRESYTGKRGRSPQ
jgi:hypothetical protein